MHASTLCRAGLHRRRDGTVACVPRISEFCGVVIEMYFRDHAPAHFHARFAEHRAAIVITSGDVLAGHLPPRTLRLVREWLSLHRDELDQNWLRARRNEPLFDIDPLR
jgi:hypothetical protein